MTKARKDAVSSGKERNAPTRIPRASALVARFVRTVVWLVQWRDPLQQLHRPDPRTLTDELIWAALAGVPAVVIFLRLETPAPFAAAAAVSAARIVVALESACGLRLHHAPLQFLGIHVLSAGLAGTWTFALLSS